MPKEFRLGPVALTTTYTTNICSPGTTTGGVASTGAPWDKLSILFRHFRIINTTGSAITFRLFIGATGGNSAGTEFMGYGLSVAANSVVDHYSPIVLENGKYLVGGASAEGLTLTAAGEIRVGY
jgi:hypothetical protein